MIINNAYYIVCLKVIVTLVVYENGGKLSVIVDVVVRRSAISSVLDTLFEHLISHARVNLLHLIFALNVHICH